MAATLVVGTFATTTTTAQSAFAYSPKKDDKRDGKGNDNGNTITALKWQNRGSASGFDTAVNQECENLICTHPGENATCVQEGAVAVQQGNQTTPVKLTCEQCFRKFLSSTGIAILLGTAGATSLEQLCEQVLPIVTEAGLLHFLVSNVAEFGLSESQAIQLVQCLLDAGIVFST